MLLLTLARGSSAEILHNDKPLWVSSLLAVAGNYTNDKAGSMQAAAMGLIPHH